MFSTHLKILLISTVFRTLRKILRSLRLILTHGSQSFLQGSKSAVWLKIIFKNKFKITNKKFANNKQIVLYLHPNQKTAGDYFKTFL